MSSHTAHSPAPGPQAQRLQSVHNFRDVAGAGYRTSTGATMRRGVFYRASVLTPTPADLTVVDTLGLAAIYDIRSDQEVLTTPVVLSPHAPYHRIPILSGDIAADALALPSADAAVTFMQEMNRSFVADSVTRGGFAQLFTSLAGTDGPQLFHCNAGKDRTGWASAVLQTLAGVDQDTVLTDYLLTNAYSAEHIDATAARVAAAGVGSEEIIRALLRVDSSYLAAAFDELAQSYGTAANYLHRGLGLTPDQIGSLERRLVD